MSNFDWLLFIQSLNPRTKHLYAEWVQFDYFFFSGVDNKPTKILKDVEESANLIGVNIIYLGNGLEIDGANIY